MIKRLLFFAYGVTCYLIFLATFLYAIAFVGGFIVPNQLDGALQTSLPAALAIDCLLLSIFAVQHSVMARPWFKERWTQFVPWTIERSTYVLCASLALLLLFWQWRPIGIAVWTVDSPLVRLGIWTVFAAGWATVLVVTFLINHFDLFGLRQVWLPLFGRPYVRVPFRTPPPYRFVRHPLYLGFLFAFWATPTMTVAHLVFALATTVYIVLAIQFEEHDLASEHGAAYQAYRRTVPMLLPWRRRPGAKASGAKSAAVLVALCAWLPAAAADAQPLGTFRWQLQPFCNVLTVSVVQTGGQFQIDGTDDLCGASRRASVVGLAFVNPDGGVGFGLTIVTAPGGVAVHVDATISLATLSGTWRDSMAASGAFVFTPAAGGGGTPRPPAPSLPAAIGLFPSGAFVAGGRFGSGAIPASGAGVRMMWHPAKAAFRAGGAGGTQWDDENTGIFSAAFGFDAQAVGPGSIAMGNDSTASGAASTAMGEFTIASGADSTAMGANTRASGAYSLAGGLGSSAGGTGSLAYGQSVAAHGNGSVVLGSNATAGTTASGVFVFADRSTTARLSVLGPNQFVARAAGGTTIFTNAAMTQGVMLPPGAGSWASMSDVNTKTGFRDLAGDDVLAKLARMPVQEWSYKAQDPSIRHAGPTAQDFHAAFGLGEDPLRINGIDADGIALAGLKALEQRTRVTAAGDAAALEVLRDRVTALERQLTAMLESLPQLRPKER